MDDYLLCLHCGEEIARIARKCKHCGEYRDSSVKVVDPGVGMLMSFVLGLTLVALLCVVSGVSAAVVGPSVVRVRKEANEKAAVEALQAIAKAQLAFQEQDMDSDGTPNFATLGELSKTGQLSPDLASGLQHQYLFEVGVSGAFPNERWLATASPITPGKQRVLYFATNHTGAIYFRQGRPFPLDLNRCEFPSDALPLGALGGLR